MPHIQRFYLSLVRRVYMHDSFRDMVTVPNQLFDTYIDVKLNMKWLHDTYPRIGWCFDKIIHCCADHTGAK